VRALVLGVVGLSGCSAMHAATVIDAMRDGVVPELASPTAGAQWIYPDHAPRPHSYYSKVSVVRAARVSGEDRESRFCSFVVGRRATDGEWEVIHASMRDDDGAWRELEVVRDAGAISRQTPDPGR
jgi:hypothetical protein